MKNIRDRVRRGMNPHYVAALYHTRDRRDADIRERFTEMELRKIYAGVTNNNRIKMPDEAREQLFYDLYRYQVALAL